MTKCSMGDLTVRLRKRAADWVAPRWAFAAMLGFASLGFTVPAGADILKLPDGGLMVETRPGLPVNGTHQSQVLARFGEPVRRHPSVGGGRPQHPVITRWDYPDFSVVFERQTVKHTVVRSAAR
ncbi:MAG: hypothetical protein ACK4IT_01205 [Thioalkalivibrionaceae bacterium]